MEVDKNLPRILSADVMRIRQIIVNLLNNGVKYTPKGNVTLCVTGEKAEDWDNYRILVHAIKSTSLTIEAKTVSGLAKAQELMVKENRIEEIPQIYEDFQQLYREALAEAKEILQEAT